MIEVWGRQLTTQIARRSRDLHADDPPGTCGLCREPYPCAAARRAATVLDVLARDDDRPSRAVGVAPVHGPVICGCWLQDLLCAERWAAEDGVAASPPPARS